MRLILLIFFFNTFEQVKPQKDNAGFPHDTGTGAHGVNLNIPKPGENRYNIPSPFGNLSKPKTFNNLNSNLIGENAAETADKMEEFVRSNVDNNTFSKTTAFDAGPNGANLKRFTDSRHCYDKIGFDPSINYSALDEMYKKCEKEHQKNLIYKALFLSIFVLFNGVVIFLSLGKKFKDFKQK
jgi:hypothetical protein